MALVSTVPGAINALKGYMTTAASSTTVPNVAVYVGKQATESALAPNFYMVGDPDRGLPVAAGTYMWAAIPGQQLRIAEHYTLQATIGCWAGGASGDGGAAAVARLGDCYTLLNSLHSQIRGDISGGGALTPSGSWGEMRVQMHEFGAVTTGWGALLSVELDVLNVQIFGP